MFFNVKYCVTHAATFDLLEIYPFLADFILKHFFQTCCSLVSYFNRFTKNFWSLLPYSLGSDNG